MSVTHSHSFNQGGRTDPTRSVTLRRKYARHLRQPLRELKGQIWRGLVKRGAMDMALNERMPVFRFTTDEGEQVVEHFMDWLNGEVRDGYLEVIESRDNKFVRNAYTKGVRFSDSSLGETGIDVPSEEMSAILNKPIHQSKIQELFSRQLTLLDGVDEDMQSAMRETLSEGLSRGEGPGRVARKLNDRVEKIGVRRSNLIARTEIINAHSEGTLTRYEELGIDTVTIKAEIQTAGDRRVCDRCVSVEGDVMEIDEVREGTFSFGNKDFPIKPPIHPDCRCVLLPVTDSVN